MNSLLSSKQNNTNKITVVLINLGSPDSYSPADVRKYLAEFLSDRRVINIPRILWLPILHGIILRTRPKKTAKLYQAIWTDNGSPLVSISKSQVKKLNEKFSLDSSTNIEIKLAMRYGNPSIKSVFDELSSESNKVLIFPMYPQYSATTIATIYDKIASILKLKPTIPELRFINSYCLDDKYITALADSITRFWNKYEKPEKLMFSYHGLPVKNIDDGDVYYEHCKQTTLLVTKKLGLKPEQYIMTFQSRFGMQEWIKPYTDFTLKELAQNGIKTLHIISPSFAADCLETLEELEVENCEYFKQNGGETYRYIPALNQCEQHIKLLEYIIRKNTNNW